MKSAFDPHKRSKTVRQHCRKHFKNIAFNSVHFMNIKKNRGIICDASEKGESVVGLGGGCILITSLLTAGTTAPTAMEREILQLKSDMDGILITFPSF